MSTTLTQTQKTVERWTADPSRTTATPATLHATSTCGRGTSSTLSCTRRWQFTTTHVTGMGNGHAHLIGELEAAGRRVPLAFDASVRMTGGELELEATTTVDQRRFGMSQGPFGNVRPPAKLHVKTRLVRERSE